MSVPNKPTTFADGELQRIADNIQTLAMAMGALTTAVEKAIAKMGSAPRPAAGGGGAPGATFPFGKAKGKPIRGAGMDDLQWVGAAVAQSVADPAKAKWKQSNLALLEAINVEIRAVGGAPIGGDYGAPADAGESDPAF